jgi:hypothetical protein
MAETVECAEYPHFIYRVVVNCIDVHPEGTVGVGL